MTAAPNVLIAGIGGASLGADHHVPSVLALCRRLEVAAIVPGGEAPTALLARGCSELTAGGIRLAASAASIFPSRGTTRSHRPVRRTRTNASTSAALRGDLARGREEMA